MSGEQEFQDAAARVQGLRSLSNDVMLTLYGLYKQATVGDVQGSRPGSFNIRGRAKFDAWSDLEGMTPEEARTEYISLANDLGA